MSNYRLAPGHITAAALMADADYLVSNFPNTGLSNTWMLASDDVISTYTQRTRTPSAKSYGLGLPSLRWVFNVLNREQVEYLFDTYTGGALSAPVTLMTYRFNNQSASGIARNWVILQATMEVNLGQTSEDTINVNDLWYRDSVLNFVRGTYLAVP